MLAEPEEFLVQASPCSLWVGRGVGCHTQTQYKVLQGSLRESQPRVCIGG